MPRQDAPTPPPVFFRLPEILLHILDSLDLDDIDAMSLTCTTVLAISRKISVLISFISQYLDEIAFPSQLLADLKNEPWRKLRAVAKSLQVARISSSFGASYPSIHSAPERKMTPFVDTLDTQERVRINCINILPGGRWLLGFSPTTIYIWDLVKFSRHPVYRVRVPDISIESTSGPLLVNVPHGAHVKTANTDVVETSYFVSSEKDKVLLGMLLWHRVQDTPISKYTTHIHVISLQMSSEPSNPMTAHRIYTLHFPTHKLASNLCLDEQHLIFGGLYDRLHIFRLPCSSHPDGIFAEIIAPASAQRHGFNGSFWMKLSSPYLFLRYARSIIILKVPPMNSRPSKTHSGDGRPKLDRQHKPSTRKGHFSTAYQIITHTRDCTPGISHQIHLPDGTLAPIRMLYKSHVLTLKHRVDATETEPDTKAGWAVDPDEFQQSELFDQSVQKLRYVKGDPRSGFGEDAQSYGVCGFSGVSGVEAKGVLENSERDRIITIRGWSMRQNDSIEASTLYKRPTSQPEGTALTLEPLFPNGKLNAFSIAFDDVMYHSLAAITLRGQVHVARFD